MSPEWLFKITHLFVAPRNRFDNYSKVLDKAIQEAKDAKQLLALGSKK
jgi:hypothetical protein